MGDAGAIGIAALIGLGCFRDVIYYNIVNHLHTGDTAFLSIIIANAILIDNIDIKEMEPESIKNNIHLYLLKREKIIILQILK